MTDERTIEKHLRDQVKARGGMHRKVVYQGRKGSPDDWCFFPSGRLLIFECKATGEKPSPQQVAEMAKLKALGQKVFLVDSKSLIDEILESYL